MNREEAISILEEEAEFLYQDDKPYSREAFDMAIEALQAEPTKAVPPSLADVYKWERDIALSQLEEYGIGFAEKKRDDLVEVVRCKDCKWHKLTDNNETEVCTNKQWDISMAVYPIISADDFCSYGERREP